MLNIVDSILVNIIFILFPILLYFVYACCDNLRHGKYKKFLLRICLVTSICLSMKYGYITENSKIILFINIPIVLAYLKKDHFIAIILSVLVILYCNYININVLIMAIKLVLYLVCYIFLLENKLKEKYFLNLIIVVQGFFLSFEYFLTPNIEDVVTLIKVLIITFAFYIVTFTAVYLLNSASKMTSLFIDFKQLQKDKQIKESLFKITHEIKNPIAVCLGYLDMLDLEDKEKVYKYIPIIRQEIGRCLNIMNEFVDFSKIKIDKEEIDINYLLEDVYDSLKIIIDNKNVEFVYKESDSEIYLNADYNRLKQVLINIVKNSYESIKKKGIISMRGFVQNKFFVIEIKDNGSGMDKETLLKIKELFYTTKKQGTGIGVALSNEIIMAHNGSLDYKSELNKGTTAIIKLPIEEV